MAHYYLWCDEADAEPCPEHARPDPVEALRQYRETGLRHHQALPELCHFDRQGQMTNEQALFMDHVRNAVNREENQHVTGGRLISGYLTGDAAIARSIRNLYRCTRHGKKPKVFRRAYAWSDRQWRVVNEHFVQMPEEDMPQEIRDWYGTLQPWQRRRPYVPRRIIPTLAHVW